MRPDLYSLTDIVNEPAYVMKPLVTPVVNLNGNGKQQLVDMLLNVKHALEDADKAFVEASDVVHGRNFQTVHDGSIVRSVAEDAWRQRRMMLQSMAMEIYALAIDISNQ